VPRLTLANPNDSSSLNAEGPRGRALKRERINYHSATTAVYRGDTTSSRMGARAALPLVNDAEPFLTCREPEASRPRGAGTGAQRSSNPVSHGAFGQDAWAVKRHLGDRPG
jgi:hypothetical protein